MAENPRSAQPDPAPGATSGLAITVLAGGPSDEREVSLQSGAAVAQALTRLGHRVTTRDIDQADHSALDIPADCVFIALHGEFGEDGQVQELLDRRGLRYVGADARASALAMNKAATKARLAEAGIPTPDYQVCQQNTRHGDMPGAKTLSPPVVVKPVSSGSSVDTFIASDQAATRAALDCVIEKFGSALVEQYIDGPELTVGILGDQALPVCQIRTKRQFYDYQAKYIDDDTEYLFDIDLPEQLLRRVQDLSLKAHRVTGCAGFSRVDWMVADKTLSPYVLEINTIPGFTSHSLLPKAAARVGITFDQLCQRIVDLAISRNEVRSAAAHSV